MHFFERRKFSSFLRFIFYFFSLDWRCSLTMLRYLRALSVTISEFSSAMAFSRFD